MILTALSGIVQKNYKVFCHEVCTSSLAEPFIPEKTWNLFVAVDFPGHVGVEGFGDGVSFLCPADSNMMLETHSADVLAKKLEIRNLHYAIAAKGIKFVVCKFALADIDTDDTIRIVGSQPAEGCLARGYPADDSAVSILFAHKSGNYLLVVHL